VSSALIIGVPRSVRDCVIVASKLT
jgi:hypothetical protein